MISAVLVRKLLVYAAYSAAITALPVLAYVPSPAPPLPILQVQRTCCDTCMCDSACLCTVRAEEPPAVAACQREDRWWCRGPVRRGVRGVALFIIRPWRR